MCKHYIYLYALSSYIYIHSAEKIVGMVPYTMVEKPGVPDHHKFSVQAVALDDVETIEEIWL